MYEIKQVWTEFKKRDLIRGLARWLAWHFSPWWGVEGGGTEREGVVGDGLGEPGGEQGRRIGMAVGGGGRRAGQVRRNAKKSTSQDSLSDDGYPEL